MKKVVLVLVCSIIIIVFIAFNYLLWERENSIRSFTNLENQNASKSVSIDALSKEIKNLNDSNKDLQKTIEGLNEEKKALQDNGLKVEQERLKTLGELEQTKDTFSALKQQGEFVPLEGIIKKWAESIDKGQYDVAYQLQSDQITYMGKKLTLDDFTSIYKKSIKNIKIKSIKAFNNDAPDSKKAEVRYKISFDVKKTNAEISAPFNEGVNDRVFTLSYIKVRNEWVISDIAQ